MSDWVIGVKMNFSELKRRLKPLGLAMGLSLAAATGSVAATFDQIETGDPLFTAQDLDVAVIGDFFDVSDVFNGIFSGFTFSGLDPVLPGTVGDLGIFGFSGVLEGATMDLAIDYMNDTIHVLYGLTQNDFGSEPAAVSVLTFFENGNQIDLIEGSFAFTDLNGAKADLDVLGATVVPLPATLPMMIAGVGGLVLLRRRRARR